MAAQPPAAPVSRRSVSPSRARAGQPVDATPGAGCAATASRLVGDHLPDARCVRRRARLAPGLRRRTRCRAGGRRDPSYVAGPAAAQPGCRRRRSGPRHLSRLMVGRADLPHRRGRHPGPRAGGRRPDRTAGRLLPRRVRPGGHVRDQRLLRHPRPAGRPDPRLPARPQPDQHHHRDRRHPLDGHGAAGPRPDAGPSRARVHRGRPRRRREARSRSCSVTSSRTRSARSSSRPRSASRRRSCSRRS